MELSNVEDWILDLGKRRADMKHGERLSDGGFYKLFPGDDELWFEPEEGVCMSFNAGSGIFERLFFTLRPTTPNCVIYTGDLPQPLRHGMNQRDIRAVLGVPYRKMGRQRLPDPIGEMGGWDLFDLDKFYIRPVFVHVTYLESMEVSCISFSIDASEA